MDVTTRTHVRRGRSQLTGIRADHCVSGMTTVTGSIGTINNRTVIYIGRLVEGVPNRTVAGNAGCVVSFTERQSQKLAVSGWGRVMAGSTSKRRMYLTATDKRCGFGGAAAAGTGVAMATGTG